MNRATFDLDKCLIHFDKESESTFTIRDAVEGVQIFGGIGSGKTSGSGRMLALKYLSHGFGGLVLTAKADEKDLWIEYCQATNRLNDLVIIGAGANNFFNFLEYESAVKSGEQSLTVNIVQLLKTVIRASEDKTGGKNDDQFWETALDMLITNVIDLCQLAYGKVSIQQLYNIVLTAPRKDKTAKQEKGKDSFDAAFRMAREKFDEKLAALKASLTDEEKTLQQDDGFMEYLISEQIPESWTIKSIDQFFAESYSNLGEKTRSIIEFYFIGFLYRLLKEPVRSLFCRNPSTVTPEDCLNGKIILLNLPVKTFYNVGRDSQVMFKYIWQRAMERRHIKENDRPVFLWADEAQHFLHEYDSEYQATARSSRVSTVYITQNLPNYFANMGGTKFEHKVKSFLGTLGTKIFHANADIDTNKYASDLIGEAYTEDTSSSITMAGNFSATQGVSYKLERMVRAERFVSLRTGGPLNNYSVDAYIHRQGKTFQDGLNFTKTAFKQ